MTRRLRATFARPFLAKPSRSRAPPRKKCADGGRANGRAAVPTGDPRTDRADRTRRVESSGRPLRWSLPPTLGCIPKQPDSKKNRTRRGGAATASHRPRAKPPSEGLGPRPRRESGLLYATFPSPAGRAGFALGSSSSPPLLRESLGTGGWPESSRSPPSATHAAGNPTDAAPHKRRRPPAGRESWGSRPRSSQNRADGRRRLPAPRGDERWRGRASRTTAPACRRESWGSRPPVLAEPSGRVAAALPAPRGDERDGGSPPTKTTSAHGRELRSPPLAAEGVQTHRSQGGEDLRPRAADEAPPPLPVGEGERRWKGPEEAGRKRTRAVCT
ncbi:hypothetical protein G5714_024706 [Onychostoma macrolepis]|uniref:Uncharacterized protein n=1 Tax=Onychostoma macrolepis TaxID=369639 RepID=A0A7J6BI88_9TELE|nr:hypothetical protein G5714_024706 [Onychostoma macrolepis]